MRIVKNLCYLLISFILTVWTGTVFAQTQETYWRASIDGFQRSRATHESACQAALTARVAAGYRNSAYHSSVLDASRPLKDIATCYAKDDSTGAAIRMGSSQLSTCAQSTPYFNGTACSATAPKPPEPPPVECKADGEIFSGTWYRGKVRASSVGTPDPSIDGLDEQTVSPVGNPRAHDGSCEIEIVDVVECFQRKGTLNAYCTYKYVRTGNQKQPAAPNVPDAPGTEPRAVDDKRTNVPPESPLPQGNCPRGTVQIGIGDDGIPKCAGTGSAPKNTPAAPPKMETEKTETAADGTQTVTKTETTNNADGSQTVVKTITIIKPDGSKQTSQDKTVTPTPNGSAGKDDSKLDDDKYDLCKQNPNLTICKNSSVAGKCGEVSCNGDAIQCATLRAAAAMQCRMDDAEKELQDSGLHQLGKALTEGNDPMGDNLPNPANATIVDVKAGLDTSGWLGGGAPFEDVSFDLMGETIVIPFAQVTSGLEFMKYAIMLVASLVSFRMIRGAVLGV